MSKSAEATPFFMTAFGCKFHKWMEVPLLQNFVHLASWIEESQKLNLLWSKSTIRDSKLNHNSFRTYYWRIIIVKKSKKTFQTGLNVSQFFPGKLVKNWYKKVKLVKTWSDGRNSGKLLYYNHISKTMVARVANNYLAI